MTSELFIYGYLLVVLAMWMSEFKMLNESGELRPNFSPHEGTCLTRILLEALVTPMLGAIYILLTPFVVCVDFFAFTSERSYKSKEETCQKISL